MNPTKAELNRYELLPRGMQSVLSWRQVNAIKYETKWTDREIGDICDIHETNVYQWRAKRVDQIPGKHAIKITGAFCRWRDDFLGRQHIDIEHALERQTIQKAIRAERSGPWQTRYHWTHSASAVCGLGCLLACLACAYGAVFGWDGDWNLPRVVGLATASGLLGVIGRGCFAFAASGCGRASLKGASKSTATCSQTS